jgi:hypothetical protein
MYRYALDVWMARREDCVMRGMLRNLWPATTVAAGPSATRDGAQDLTDWAGQLLPAVALPRHAEDVLAPTTGGVGTGAGTAAGTTAAAGAPQRPAGVLRVLPVQSSRTSCGAAEGGGRPECRFDLMHARAA